MYRLMHRRPLSPYLMTLGTTLEHVLKAERATVSYDLRFAQAEARLILGGTGDARWWHQLLEAILLRPEQMFLHRPTSAILALKILDPYGHDRVICYAFGYGRFLLNADRIERDMVGEFGFRLAWAGFHEYDLQVTDWPAEFYQLHSHDFLTFLLDFSDKLLVDNQSQDLLRQAILDQPIEKLDHKDGTVMNALLHRLLSATNRDAPERSSPESSADMVVEQIELDLQFDSAHERLVDIRLGDFEHYWTLEDVGTEKPDVGQLLSSFTAGALGRVRFETLHRYGDLYIQLSRRLDRCISAVLTDGTMTYQLSSGTWHSATISFVAKLRQDLLTMVGSGVQFPQHRRIDTERAYNYSTARLVGGICLDGMTVPIAGTRSRIELCDIGIRPSTNSDMRHTLVNVKRFGLVRVSHLIAQAYGSITLLLEDSQFRNMARQMIHRRDPLFASLVDSKLIGSDFRVILHLFGVPSQRPILDALPLLNLLLLRLLRNELANEGVTTNLDSVSTV